MPERCPECNLLGGHLDGCSHIATLPKYTPPDDLRSAAYVILAVAFFYSLGLGIPLFVALNDPISGHPIDTFGRVAAACLGTFSALLWASSILLLLRRRAGVYLWWICSPVVVLAFPLGTMAGIYIIRRLRGQAVQDEFAKR